VATRSYPFLTVEQPVGTFYLSIVNSVELLNMVDILRRGLSEAERENVQRKLNPTRARDIAAYIADPDATFPTSIIVSVYSDAVTVDEKKGRLIFKDDETIGEVIDGQHRLEGIRRVIDEGNKSLLSNFELPVVFMIDLPPEDKAYVFSIINSKQTPVSSSLIFDLFGLRQTRSPRKTCHEIAETFNGDPKGPFFRGIKMLGNKSQDTEILTQGAFVKYVLQLITNVPDEDERREKTSERLVEIPGCPLRSLYLKEKDDVIAKILKNYFLAAQAAFPHEWDEDPKKYLLRKTAGFSALITVFKEIWPELERSGDASFAAFEAIFKRLKRNATKYQLTSHVFGSSEQGAKRLANLLLHGTPPDE
jgi:DGQHR domain-containing protein